MRSGVQVELLRAADHGALCALAHPGAVARMHVLEPLFEAARISAEQGLQLQRQAQYAIVEARRSPGNLVLPGCTLRSGEGEFELMPQLFRFGAREHGLAQDVAQRQIQQRGGHGDEEQPFADAPRYGQSADQGQLAEQRVG